MVKWFNIAFFIFICARAGCSAPMGAVVTAVASLSSNTLDHRSTSSAARKWVPPGISPCAEIPSGPLSDEDLKKLVPENSTATVRIKWATESQEETYGFNIMRSDKPDGEYHQINSSIIPGEGSTNIPHSYCYQDTSVKRGSIYYYQIEEVSNNGDKSIIEGTQATRVKVKSIAEERALLKKEAEGKGP